MFVKSKNKGLVDSVPIHNVPSYNLRITNTQHSTFLCTLYSEILYIYNLFSSNNIFINNLLSSNHFLIFNLLSSDNIFINNLLSSNYFLIFNLLSSFTTTCTIKTLLSH